MATLPRQRASRTVHQISKDAISAAPVQKGSRKHRQRRELTPATMMISFGLLPALVLVYLIFKSIVSTKHKRRPWNPKEEGHTSRVFKVLTAYLEPPFDTSTRPLPSRDTINYQLTPIEFPNVKQCSTLWESFPIDDYPTSDPFLPWIHDVFPTADGSEIRFVAQNRRRCDVGINRTESMKFWESQLALFQPIPIVQEDDKLRLASSMEEATVQETRFLCHFHTADNHDYTTFSTFPFNYEYVSWRKERSSMLEKSGKDNQQFWLSQLMFQCPVPIELRTKVANGKHIIRDMTQLWVDIIPIRTPVRDGEHLFTTNHVGPNFLKTDKLLDLKHEFGTEHYLPDVNRSGRWANIPICSPPPVTKQHKLTVCTWTSASYTRRGDKVKLGDTEARLREWILFQKLVGADNVVIYDNTSPDLKVSPLARIAAEFSYVEYHKWPCAICNNNRPNHPNPGERSSQYAAEASCRERYGPSTDWMAFIDTDEYLVPMASDTWLPILENFEEKKIHILKMRSSRAKPRIELMDELDDQSVCVDPVNRKNMPEDIEAEPCIGPRNNETFLHVYNCEYIRPPRPERFQRAMKQIYRPSHVLSHFVHYSTVTADIARLYNDFGPLEKYERNTHQKSWKQNAPEIFLNDLTEGTLVHTRSVLPHETQYKSYDCELNSKNGCAVGYLCPDEELFSDELHKKNAFKDSAGRYCNCWRNSKIEDFYVPRLETLVKQHMEMIK